jgi:hypothetical protein
LKREVDHSDDQDLARSRDDIIVKAVMVQGGEANIGGEKTAFARIVMSGVGVQQVKDLLVAQVSADGAAVPAVTGMTSTVRVDFTGTLVQALTVANPAVHVQGAIFSGPRQAQALVSSLRKVVRSALEQPRVENYVSAAASLSAFRI